MKLIGIKIIPKADTLNIFITMRITVKVGILFAIGWILVKLSLFGMGYDTKDVIVPAAFINMFFLILAITIGLYLQKRKDLEDGNALRDIKNGMSAGIPYTILVSIFIYFYYAKIDADYLKHQLVERQTELVKQLNNPKTFQKIKDSNADFEVMTKAQIQKKIMINDKSGLSANSSTIMALLAMTMYTTLNSVFITIIFRKIVFKRKTL